jgi:hypothetical protein
MGLYAICKFMQFDGPAYNVTVSHTPVPSTHVVVGIVCSQFGPAISLLLKILIAYGKETFIKKSKILSKIRKFCLLYALK